MLQRGIDRLFGYGKHLSVFISVRLLVLNNVLAFWIVKVGLS